MAPARLAPARAPQPSPCCRRRSRALEAARAMFIIRVGARKACEQALARAERDDLGGRRREHTPLRRGSSARGAGGARALWHPARQAALRADQVVGERRRRAWYWRRGDASGSAAPTRARAAADGNWRLRVGERRRHLRARPRAAAASSRSLRSSSSFSCARRGRWRLRRREGCASGRERGGRTAARCCSWRDVSLERGDGVA